MNGALTPSASNMTRPVAPLVSADGRVASSFYAPFHLFLDVSRWVPWAFFWRHSFEHRHCCPASAHLLCVRVILPPHCLVVHVDTPSRSRGIVGSEMLVLQKVIVVRAPRGHAPAAIGTKLFVTTVKRTRYDPSLSAPLERILPSRARCRGPRETGLWQTVLAS